MLTVTLPRRTKGFKSLVGVVGSILSELNALPPGEPTNTVTGSCLAGLGSLIAIGSAG